MLSNFINSGFTSTRDSKNTSENKYDTTTNTNRNIADKQYFITEQLPFGDNTLTDSSEKLPVNHLQSGVNVTATKLNETLPIHNIDILDGIAKSQTQIDAKIIIKTSNLEKLQSKLANLVIQRPDLHIEVRYDGVGQTKFVITITTNNVPGELYFAKGVLTTNNIKILVEHMETQGSTVKRLISHSLLIDDGYILSSLVKNNQLEYFELYFDPNANEYYGQELMLNIVKFILARLDLEYELNLMEIGGKSDRYCYKFTATKNVNNQKKELCLGILELTDAITRELVKYLESPECQAESLNCKACFTNSNIFSILDAIAKSKTLTNIEPLHFKITSDSQLKSLKTKVEALKEKRPKFGFELKQYEDANGKKDTSRYVLKQMEIEMETISDQSDY